MPVFKLLDSNQQQPALAPRLRLPRNFAFTGYNSFLYWVMAIS